MALGYRSFRHRGMPFSTGPREQPHGTWPMCRVVVAARRLVPDRQWSVFRALQFAQFTSAAALDDPAALESELEWLPGIDAAALVAAAAEPETEELFAADRAARPHRRGRRHRVPGPLGDHAGGRGPLYRPERGVRDDGRPQPRGWRLPARGGLRRRDREPRPHARSPRAGDDVNAVLAAFPDGLTTAEVAAVMAPHLQPPDRDAAEDALISAVAAGGAERRPFGNDALWTPAATAAGALEHAA